MFWCCDPLTKASHNHGLAYYCRCWVILRLRSECLTKERRRKRRYALLLHFVTDYLTHLRSLMKRNMLLLLLMPCRSPMTVGHLVFYQGGRGRPPGGRQLQITQVQAGHSQAQLARVLCGQDIPGGHHGPQPQASGGKQKSWDYGNHTDLWNNLYVYGGKKKCVCGWRERG